MTRPTPVRRFLSRLLGPAAGRPAAGPPARLAVCQLEDRAVASAVVVGNTTAAPYRATVDLEMYFDTNRNGRLDPADGSYTGSGALIGPGHVLTAAHCVFDRDPGTPDRGWATWVRVIPGRNGAREPFGAAWATRLATAPGYNQGDDRADVGVIRLDREIGARTGWYKYADGGAALRPNTPVGIHHYPGDQGNRQIASRGPATRVTATDIAYRERALAVVPGSSGGPVVLNGVRVDGRAENNVVVGVVSRGNGETGIAARLNRQVAAFVDQAVRAAGNRAAAVGQDAGDPAAGAERATGGPLPDGTRPRSAGGTLGGPAARAGDPTAQAAVAPVAPAAPPAVRAAARPPAAEPAPKAVAVAPAAPAPQAAPAEDLFALPGVFVG